jgi:hypothetical protein
MTANTPAPESISVLDAIYQRAVAKGDLQVAFCMTLVAEWNTHARKYALDWPANMRSRGFTRLIRIDDAERARVQDAAKRVGQNCLVPMTKDLHIVCLAVQTDKRVVSHETSLPKQLKAAKRHYLILGTIHWARPCHAPTVHWLQAGAPDDDALVIDAYP